MQNRDPTTGEYFFFPHFDFPREDPPGSGQYNSNMEVSVWNNDFTSSRTETVRFAHPTSPADPTDYEEHLLNVREPIPGSDYQAYQRVIKQRFTAPDRNADDMIDIADLITRIEETATTRGLSLIEQESLCKTH